MPIVQQGSINTTALVVPDLYVQIVPPQNLVLNGVPTNVVGVVGTASWGPSGSRLSWRQWPTTQRSFGPIVARKYDMGTQVATAVQQGAQNFRCCARLGRHRYALRRLPRQARPSRSRHLYSGSLGNQVVLALSAGSKPSTWRLTVSLPGLQPEVFDAVGGTGASFWTALAAAVNQGQGPQRGPSHLVVANAGGSHGGCSGILNHAGIWDGRDATARRGVAAAQLVGSDALPRTGMYGLRGQGCGIAVLADADDPTQWTTQAGFGLAGRDLHDPDRAGGRYDPNGSIRQEPGRARQLCCQVDVR